MLAYQKYQHGRWNEYCSDDSCPHNGWVLEPEEPVALLQEQDERCKPDRQEDITRPVDIPNLHSARTRTNERPGEPEIYERPGEVEIIKAAPTEVLRHEPADPSIERARRGRGKGEYCQSNVARSTARQRRHHGNEQHDGDDAGAKALDCTKNEEGVLAPGVKARKGAGGENRARP